MAILALTRTTLKVPPMKHRFSIFICLLCLFLSACGGGHETGGITPLNERNDPKDEKLVEAVTAFVALQGAPPNSEYDYVRVDLNGDGRRDGIVLFKLPHSYWCGWDGCGMAIFRAHNDGFTTMSTVNNVRGPIYVRRTGHQGWRDIIIRVSGTNMPDKNVVLAYNGSGYPHSPMLARTLETPLSAIQTEKFFR